MNGKVQYFNKKTKFKTKKMFNAIRGIIIKNKKVIIFHIYQTITVFYIFLLSTQYE